MTDLCAQRTIRLQSKYQTGFKAYRFSVDVIRIDCLG